MLPQSKRERVTEKVLQLADTPGAIMNVANWRAEEATVGAVLQAPDLFAVLSDKLQPGDFHNLFNGLCWYAFEQLTKSHKAIDVITVVTFLLSESACPIKDEYELQSAVTKLVAQGGIVEHAETYADDVREAALRIRLVKAVDAIKAKALDRSTKIETLRDQSNQLIFAATDQRGEAYTSASAVIGAYFDKMQSAMENGARPGVLSGFKDLDTLTSGFYPGEVTVLAGNEGMGKTTLLLSFVRDICKRGGAVVLFTLEMTQEEIMRIFIAMETGISKDALKRMQLNPGEWAAFTNAAGQVSQWKLNIIDEFPMLKPIQLRRKLRKLMATDHVDMVAIDGLWLMDADEPSKEGRFRDVYLIMRDLNTLAKEETFFLPVVITHQYKGEVVDQPRLHDLAESAGVRRNAQVVLGMYRPTYQQGASDLPDFTQLHILKDRNGTAVGRQVTIGYNPSYSRYEGTIHASLRDS